jgi:hypothetical protein
MADQSRAPIFSGPAWNDDGSIKDIWKRWFNAVGDLLGESLNTQITAIYQGQYIPFPDVQALMFGTINNSTLMGLTVVPAGMCVLLNSLWVTNVTNAPVSMRLWRGVAATSQFPLTGGTGIIIPISTILEPGFQVLDRPIILMPGDAIWGLASASQSLNITGDGEVVSS